MEQRIGKYEVRRRIGEGSSSLVWLCRDPFEKREVAVKVAKPEALTDPRHSHIYHKLFSVEAHLAGRLHHPHIAEIYDAVDEGPLKYLVLEYVQGGTLERYCRPDRLLPYEKVVEVLFKCSRALEYAHRNGITHRDIKPANILCVETNGIVQDVKITDFGTAVDSHQDTTVVAGIGSPAYMSPEQIAEGSMTHQTDIYSLGVVAYQLITGHLPFEAPNNAAMVYQVLHADAPHPRSHRVDIPERLCAIVAKAMEKDVAKRYADWDSFAADLADYARKHLDKPDSKEVADTERFNLLKKLRFFAAFDDVQLWEVVRFADWSRVSPAHMLFAEGERGTHFFIVAEGAVRVSKHGRLLSELDTGECVGEMAYLGTVVKRATKQAAANDEAPVRSADVTTTRECTLIRISTDALSRATAPCQLSFNRAFLARLIERLQLANQKLST
jgi:serine/threonine protein kinase